jgi:hypothetical protein
MTKALKLIAFTPIALLLLSIGSIADVAYIIYMPETMTNKWVVSIALFLIYMLIEPLERNYLWSNKKELATELMPITILMLVGAALPFWTDLPTRIGFIFNL